MIDIYNRQARSEEYRLSLLEHSNGDKRAICECCEKPRPLRSETWRRHLLCMHENHMCKNEHMCAPFVLCVWPCLALCAPLLLCVCAGEAKLCGCVGGECLSTLGVPILTFPSAWVFPWVSPFRFCCYAHCFLMFFYGATLFLHVAQCAVTTALPGPGCNAHLLSGRDQFASLRVTHFSSQDLVTRHPFIRSSKAAEPWDLGVW